MPAVSIARLHDELMMIYAKPRAPLRPPPGRASAARIRRCSRSEKDQRIRAVAVAKWMDMHPDRTAVTTKSLLRCLRAIVHYATEEGYLKHSPFGFRKVGDWIRDDAARDRAPPRHRSIGDVTQVLELADLEALGGAWDCCRLRALIHVYAYLGLRAAEALHLWAADVDLFRSALTLQAHPEDGWKPKTLKSAAVLPIASPLAGVLGRLAAADWLSLAVPGQETTRALAVRRARHPAAGPGQGPGPAPECPTSRSPASAKRSAPMPRAGDSPSSK